MKSRNTRHNAAVQSQLESWRKKVALVALNEELQQTKQQCQMYKAKVDLVEELQAAGKIAINNPREWRTGETSNQFLETYDVVKQQIQRGLVESMQRIWDKSKKKSVVSTDLGRKTRETQERKELNQYKVIERGRKVNHQQGLLKEQIDEWQQSTRNEVMIHQKKIENLKANMLTEREQNTAKIEELANALNHVVVEENVQREESRYKKEELIGVEDRLLIDLKQKTKETERLAIRCREEMSSIERRHQEEIAEIQHKYETVLTLQKGDRSRITELKKENVTLLEKLEDSLQEVARSRSKIKKATECNQALKERIKEMTEDHKQFQDSMLKENKQSREEMETLKAKLKSIKWTMKENVRVNARNTKLQRAVQALRAQVDENRPEMTELTQHYKDIDQSGKDEHETECMEDKDWKEESSALIKRLRERLSVKSADLQIEIIRDIQWEDKMPPKYQTKLNHLEEVQNQLKSNLREQQQANAQLRAQIGELQEESIRCNKGERDKYSKEIKTLRLMLKESHRAQNATTQLTEQHLAERIALIEQNKVLRQQSDKWKSDWSVTEGENRTLKDKVQRMTANHRNAIENNGMIRKENEELSSLLKRKESEIVSDKESIEEMKESLLSLNASSENDRDKIDKLQSQLELKEDQIHKMTEKQRQIEKSLNEEKTQSRQSKQSLHEMERFVDEMKSSMKQFETLKKEKVTLDAQNTKLQENEAKTQSEIQSLLRENDERQKRIEDLDSQILIQQKDIESDRERYQQKLDELKQEHDAQNQQNEEEIGKLKNDLFAAAKEKQALMAKIQKMKRKYEALIGEMERIHKQSEEQSILTKQIQSQLVIINANNHNLQKLIGKMTSDLQKASNHRIELLKRVQERGRRLIDEMTVQQEQHNEIQQSLNDHLHDCKEKLYSVRAAMAREREANSKEIELLHQELQQTVQQKEEMYQSLTSKNDQLLFQLDQKTVEMSSAERQHQDQIAEIKTKHDLEMRPLIEDRLELIEQREENAKIRQRLNECSQEIIELQSKVAQTLSDNSNVKDQISRMSSKHQQSLHGLEANMETDRKEHVAKIEQFDKALSHIVSEGRALLRDKQNELERVKDVMTEMNKSIMSKNDILLSDLGQRTKRLRGWAVCSREMLLSTRKRHNNDIAEIKKEHKSELDHLYESRLRVTKLKEDEIAELSKKLNQCLQEITEMQSKLKETTDHNKVLKEQIAGICGKHKQSLDDMKALQIKLGSIKSTTREVEEMQSEVEEYSQDIQCLNTKGVMLRWQKIHQKIRMQGPIIQLIRNSQENMSRDENEEVMEENRDNSLQMQFDSLIAHKILGEQADDKVQSMMRKMQQMTSHILRREQNEEQQEHIENLRADLTTDSKVNCVKTANLENALVREDQALATFLKGNTQQEMKRDENHKISKKQEWAAVVTDRWDEETRDLFSQLETIRGEKHPFKDRPNALCDAAEEVKEPKSNQLLQSLQNAVESKDAELRAIKKARESMERIIKRQQLELCEYHTALGVKEQIDIANSLQKQSLLLEVTPWRSGSS